MSEICDKHKQNPVKIYCPCIGCELEDLQSAREQLNILKAALEYYADDFTWIGMSHTDSGRRACSALDQINGKGVKKMSSECRCHLNEWCFYCEMYMPLEKNYNIAIAALEEIATYKRDVDEPHRYAYDNLKRMAVEALSQINGKGDDTE
jgi:hypothetical protein